MLCDDLRSRMGRRRGGPRGRDTWIHVAESLHYIAETNTTVNRLCSNQIFQRVYDIEIKDTFKSLIITFNFNEIKIF